MAVDVKQIGDRVAKESAVLEAIRNEARKVIVGQSELIDRLIMALLCNQHVLIEGGGKTLGEALDRHLIDRIVFYIAPVLLGGPTPALGGHGVPSNESAIHLKNPTYRLIGPDLRIEGEVQR